MTNEDLQEGKKLEIEIQYLRDLIRFFEEAEKSQDITSKISSFISNHGERIWLESLCKFWVQKTLEKLERDLVDTKEEFKNL